jgi:hypothetical protein
VKANTEGEGSADGDGRYARHDKLVWTYLSLWVLFCMGKWTPAIKRFIPCVSFNTVKCNVSMRSYLA